SGGNYSVVLNGQNGNDLAFADYATGIPVGQARVTFNGGPNTSAGDSLRIAGDGVGTGSYTPSNIEIGGGSVQVGGNLFDFTNVEPLVVHGLSDLDVVTPPSVAANLTVDSIRVADLNLKNLVLHTLTVDGAVGWEARQELILNDPALDTKHAGQAVATSGNTLVVGAEREDGIDGSVIFPGVATVYTWNGSWVEQTKLYPSDRLSAGLGFGNAVAIDGNTIVVGAPRDNSNGFRSGAVYVFVRDGNYWTEQAKLWADDAQNWDEFGGSVSLTGDTLFVGAAGSRDSVYVFLRSAGRWSQQARLTSTGIDDFGRSVAVVGSTAVIGAPNTFVGAEYSGVAYVYTGSGNNWQRAATLTPSEPQHWEAFGSSVGITLNDGGKIVVGAPYWDNNPTGLNGNSDHGRAFVFEGSGGNWTRTARLTADAGLPASDGPPEKQAFANFGQAVQVDGNMVAVGAPNYSGTSTAQGAVYMFYRLPDQGSNTGASWTRSSGASGSGKLIAASPAGSDPSSSDYAAPDRFGTSIALSGQRIVVGIPGFNDGARRDVGATRTFTTDLALPGTSLAQIAAELLPDPRASDDNSNGASRFGSSTYYDAPSRTLFVADPNLANAVFVYINEGLSWRHVQTLAVGGAFGFGTDIAVDGDRLVIGAPDSNRVLIYQRAGEQWNHTADLYGSGGFGTSVAISGNLLVVGMPSATTRYNSTDQPIPGQLDMGVTGGAVTFRFNGSVWNREDILFPYENGLPDRTWNWYTHTPSNWNHVTLNGAFRGIGSHLLSAPPRSTLVLQPGMRVLIWAKEDNIYQWDNWGVDTQTITLPNFQMNGVLHVGTIDSGTVLVPFPFLFGQIFYFPVATPAANVSYHDKPTQTYYAGHTWVTYTYKNSNHSQYSLNPYTHVTLVDSGNNGSFRWNANYTGSFVNGSFDTGFDHKIDRVFVSSTRQTHTRTDPVAIPSDYRVHGAGFGSAVSIVGNRVFVGAPGESRMASYDVSQSDYSYWNANIGGFVGAPLRPYRYRDDAGSFGAELQARNTEEVIVGAPGSGIVACFQPNTFSNGSIAGTSGGPGGLAGDESIAARGNHLLAGSASANVAALYTSNTCAYVNQTYEPYIDSGVTMIKDTRNVGFGRGGQLISEGFVVVGTQQNSTFGNPLYNFRRRGPAWSGGETTVPARPPLGELGSSVAVDGNTVAMGARDYDSRGAVFIYGADSATPNFRVQPADLDPGDQFGASVALHGDHLVVGAPSKAGGAGSVYMFQRIGSEWIQTAVFRGAAGARLGTFLAVEGSQAVVGAPGQPGAAEQNKNLVYFYELTTGAGWQQTQVLSDAGARGVGGEYGAAVSLEGNTVVIGAPDADFHRGVAEVYVKSGSVWTLQQTILGRDTGAVDGDRFGAAVSVSGDRLAVGSPGVQSSKGAVRTFSRIGGTWSLLQELSLASGVANDYFGFSLALDGDQLLVGAYGVADGAGNRNRGAAFAFRLSNGEWRN
ncbi:MAG: hypothetical protein ACKV0T_03790, partial [Planctomycetales bacterium]